MGKRWVKQRKADPFYRRAKAQGYRSRAAFKLLQTQERFGVLHLGDLVLDLGAAPGSWSQVVQDIIGPRGRVVAVDLMGMAPLPGVDFIRGDIRENSTVQTVLTTLGRPADVLISDMSPRLSGNKATDHARSVDLALTVLDLAKKALRPGGGAVVKIFQGDLYAETLAAYGVRFHEARGFGPRASRRESAEIYLVARGFWG